MEVMLFVHNFLTPNTTFLSYKNSYHLFTLIYVYLNTHLHSHLHTMSIYNVFKYFSINGTN